MAMPARLAEIVEEFGDLPAELRLEALLDYSRVRRDPVRGPQRGDRGRGPGRAQRLLQRPRPRPGDLAPAPARHLGHPGPAQAPGRRAAGGQVGRRPGSVGLSRQTAGLEATNTALSGSPGASWTATPTKPASASMERASSSPQAAPRPAPPPASDTVRQCMVLTE